MAHGKKDATFAKDGYIIHRGFRIRAMDKKSVAIFEVDLGKRSGKHVRKRFDTINEAKRFADLKRIEADNDGMKAKNFTEQQKEDAVRALKLLEGYNVTLTDAAGCFVKHNRLVDHTNSTDELIGAYLNFQKGKLERGELRPRSVAECNLRLAGFREDMGHMVVDVISGNDIDSWLDGKEFGPTDRDNFKRYISGFFNWCVKRDHIDMNPVVKCRDVRKQNKRPQIYTVKQVEQIMSTAVTFAREPVKRKQGKEKVTVYRTEIIPYLALGFFAGLRPDEIRRLHWKDIDFSAKEIHVNADTSKTSTERTVQITGGLATYLLPHRKAGNTLIFPLSETSLTRWRQEIFKRAEIKSIQDGARHTFATFFLALNTIDDTILELGHSTSKMLFKHYRGMAKNRKKSAQEYFALAQPKNSGLIQFKEGAA